MPGSRRDDRRRSAARHVSLEEGGSAARSRHRRGTRTARLLSLRFWLLVAIVPLFVLVVAALMLVIESVEPDDGEARSRLTPERTGGEAHASPPLSPPPPHELPRPLQQEPPANASSSSQDKVPRTVQTQRVHAASSTDAATLVARHPAGARVLVPEDADLCPASSGGDHGRDDVSFVTQASADRLWMIPHICARWGGEMIVVTLRPDGEEHFDWPSMFASPNGTAPGQGSPAPLPAAQPRIGVWHDGRCSLRLVEVAARASDGDAQQGYPINRLRNAGIQCVVTSHYLVVDVDFWPSTDLLSLLRAQLAAWGAEARPLALVVPNFQRSGHGCRNDDDANACRAAFDRGHIQMPNDFAALRACLREKNCAVFDGEYNPQGQASTDVRAWQTMPLGSTRRIPCITSERYEPFVALRKSPKTPTFDERFTGYGKNKVQIIVHLRRAGFAFEVLSRGFVVHFPHQRSASKHHWLHSGAHGRVDRLFSSFGRELATLYAATIARTPLCKEARRDAGKRGYDGEGALSGSRAHTAAPIEDTEVFLPVRGPLMASADPDANAAL